MSAVVPANRIHPLNEAPARAEGEFVLYWMLGARRLRSNFALERAIQWAKELGKGLLVLEPIRCDYPYASDRHHRFVLEGMADSRAYAEGKAVTYLAYVEREKYAAKGMIAAYAERAAVIVTDLSGIPWITGMTRSAAARSAVRVEAVDSLGLLPMRATAGPSTFAHQFRRHLQKTLPGNLEVMPSATPLAHLELPRVSVPDEIAQRWPLAIQAELEAPEALLASLPIDHRVPAVPLRGGSAAAHARLGSWIRDGLSRYVERSHPDSDSASGLSPWLHFGHLGAHEVFHAVMQHAHWTPEKLAKKPTGTRDGWWNASGPVDAFLDELVTWRELGHSNAYHGAHVAEYSGIPEWAQKTLEAHRQDARPALYTDAQLMAAKTGDPLWNAAQRELLATGRIHNYLRMIWGKRVLEWTEDPKQAFDRLITMNDTLAIDGRDPNSWCGISWVFGRYDRPWAPERPIFGTVRFMSSENTKKKLDQARWLAKWSAPGGPAQRDMFAR
jgi:deoxyribodipyrimidine photo-lyase